jgi:hypothetical protein
VHERVETDRHLLVRPVHSMTRLADRTLEPRPAERPRLIPRVCNAILCLGTVLCTIRAKPVEDSPRWEHTVARRGGATVVCAWRP